MIRRFTKQERGFTVVEMLVVLAVVGLISSVIFANYRGQQRESSLIRSAQKLALDLRRAQNLALSSTLHYSQIPYGYGVHLDIASPTSYSIFAKCDPNNLYYNPAANACWTAYEEKVGTFQLESGVRISGKMKVSGSCVSGSPNADVLDIVFKPPEPATTVVRDSVNPPPACSTGEIKLGLEQDDTKTKKVIISTTGEIKIQ